MSEFLVTLDPIDTRYDGGDVIAVCPDGWGWGLVELSKPTWRILTLPSIPIEVGNAMIEPLYGAPDSDGQHGDIIKRRIRHFDFGKAAFSSLRGMLDSRGANVEKISMDAVHFTTGQREKLL